MGYKLKSLTVLSTIVLIPSIAYCNKYSNPFPNFTPECYVGVPEIDDKEIDSLKTPVKITSDSVESQDNNELTFIGNVSVEQANRRLKADKTSYNRSDKLVNASGNISYSDGYITVQNAREVSASLESQDLTIKNPEYQLHSSPTHGQASNVYYNNKNKTYKFNDATITTCKKNQETWKVKAGTVNIDEHDVFGEAWNAWLYVKDIPVLYVPYFYFPIKNERKTGFLYPSLKYDDDDGLTISTPFYWNIAPNYDLTITPTFMGHRGLQINNNFRYMTAPLNSGNIVYEFIGHDKLAYDENSWDGSRWFLHWGHNARYYNNSIHLNVDYNKVKSDDFNYFNDFHNEYGDSDKLLQKGSVKYFPNKYTELEINATNYQMLIPTATPQISILPQISAKNFILAKYANVYTYGEISRFAFTNNNNKLNNYYGNRFHFQTQFDIPFVQLPFFQFDSSFKAMFTSYDQTTNGALMSFHKKRGFTTLDDTVNRFIPSVKLQARLILDNEFNFLGSNYNQSFEPTFQYYYVPYRNQDNIGLYDTTDYIQDYDYLFGDNKYAGIDRISDENRLSFGIVSRITDNNNHERAKFSIGQALYLSDNKVKLYPNYKNLTDHRSFINGSLNIRPLQNVYFNGIAVYDTEKHNLYRGSSALEYNNNDDLIAQINYRYIRKGNTKMFDYKKYIDLKQFGMHLSTKLTNELSVIVAGYYDLEQKKNIDRVIKLNYDTCCWRFSIYAEQINKPNNQSLRSHEDKSIGIQFELKGLSSFGSKNDNYSLDTDLLHYYRPFDLSE